MSLGFFRRGHWDVAGMFRAGDGDVAGVFRGGHRDVAGMFGAVLGMSSLCLGSVMGVVPRMSYACAVVCRWFVQGW